LLIFDLSTPKAESQNHFIYIEKFSKHLLNWKKVIYINDYNKFDSSLRNKILEIKFNNIFLSQNINELNNLVIKEFTNSNIVCYGDALGLNFSNKYYFPNINIKPKIKYSEYILSLINLFDQKLDLYTKIKSKTLLTVIDDSSNFLKINTINTFSNLNYLLSKNKKVIFILTANYSETGRMALKDEVKCYVECLSKYNSNDDCLIIIKPHPRDSIEKHRLMGDMLLDITSNFIFLKEYFKYIPFEIIYHLLLNKYSLNTKDHEILSSSSSILFIEYLFKKRCEFIFGTDIVRKYFTKNWVKIRIQHEKDIMNAIDLIRSNKFI